MHYGPVYSAWFDLVSVGVTGMLSRLFEKVRTSIAIYRLNEMPSIQYGRRAIDTYWTGNREIIKDFSEHMVKRQAEKMMEEVIRVANAPDPRMANRENLTNWILECAQFQVLVIDPPPAEDPTGLRGQPGITGELKARLFELAQKDKTLREFMHSFDTPKDWDDVWDPVLMRYRMAFSWTHIFHMLRFAFDDVNHAEGKDWFKPYFATMCAWQEHQYRCSLGMPPSLDGSKTDADLRSIAISSFVNCVMEGARYPDLEWKERMQMVERDDEDMPNL